MTNTSSLAKPVNKLILQLSRHSLRQGHLFREIVLPLRQPQLHLIPFFAMKNREESTSKTTDSNETKAAVDSVSFGIQAFPEKMLIPRHGMYGCKTISSDTQIFCTTNE